MATAPRDESLVLVPASRRQGIGNAVVTQILLDADRRRLPVRLGVLIGNPSQAFWARHGFEVIGEHDPQHLLMERVA